MCGITAIFSETPSRELATNVARSMRLMAHRGPDGEGLVAGDATQVKDEGPSTWALGHVRLAILDLSQAGAQPMPSADRMVWTTFNGEIYNYLELADELARLGHTFRSRSDTEVLVSAYQQWGDDCVQRFRGMFAFVIVDLQQQRALIARDRLGIKPLYLWRSGGSTFVVSEPKQFYAFDRFQPRLDVQQAVDYLSEGLLGHEARRTMFSEVEPLAAGTRLSWNLGQQPRLSEAKVFWEPNRTEVDFSWQGAVDKVEELFCDAVRLRLRSDVPVGTCLSGGIDSSSIVGVAYHDFGVRMKTFSVCNNDPRINEQPYIDAVNRECQSESVKFFLNEEDVETNFEAFIYHQDEPTFSLSQFGEYCVMRLAREHGVPVLLNGQGGDETLCGYRKFAFFYLRQLLKQSRYGAATAHLANLLAFGDRQLLQFWQGVRYAPAWLKRRYDVMADILRPDWRAKSRGAWRSAMQGTFDLHEHQWADLRRWSLPVLLRYQDRNSMAHGVEARVPMVDHEFVELALTLPSELFFKQGMTKRVLVEAMGARLPKLLRVRKTKLGFDTPQARWLRGRLGQQLEDCVRRCDRLDPILDRDAAGRAFQDYREGSKRIPHFFLYRMACLAVWLDRFQVAPA